MEYVVLEFWLVAGISSSWLPTDFLTYWNGKKMLYKYLQSLLNQQPVSGTSWIFQCLKYNWTKSCWNDVNSVKVFKGCIIKNIKKFYLRIDLDLLIHFLDVLVQFSACSHLLLQHTQSFGWCILFRAVQEYHHTILLIYHCIYFAFLYLESQILNIENYSNRKCKSDIIVIFVKLVFKQYPHSKPKTYKWTQ